MHAKHMQFLGYLGYLGYLIDLFFKSAGQPNLLNFPNGFEFIHFILTRTFDSITPSAAVFHYSVIQERHDLGSQLQC